MSRGRFVTFEGGEGAGKSSALAAAAARLRAHGIAHRLTREPGGTPLGEAVRGFVLDPAHRICAEAELLLMFAARAQHVVDVIAPALAAGEWVLCDRYVDASHAYQGAGRGQPAERIDALARWAAQDLVPDRTLLLDVAPEEGLRRAAVRGAADRLESEPTSFHERVRAAYRARAAADPKRFRVIDTTRSIEAVAADVAREIDALVAEGVT